jgi:glycosyltransferase involved in cell wall biosynthesis
MLGRIARWKGQDVFVTAAARLCEHDPTTTFLVAGSATTEADAAFERDLRSQVDRAGLSDRIQFLGLVDDVPDLLRSVDLAVHCSTSPEPFGQVILEAMAASVPVVATALGGPAEIITNGVDGRLVPPGDDEALARVLAELLRHGALRRQLAARGLETVRNRFGIQQTARQVAAVYEEGAA